MADDRKRQSLTAEQLREVLDRLNDVLTEAQRLRDEITARLETQQHDQQQFLSSGGKKKRRPKR
jgi:hypothetical protein